MKTDDLKEKAALIRKWCLIATTQAASGHPTSCMSAADIMTVLFDKFYTYDLQSPQNQNNDRLIFSKGHAAPLLYTLYAVAGAFPLEDLRTLRKFGSPLEGHPTPKFKYTEAATGSLGQGLSIGAGFAYVAKKDNRDFKTYVLMGDGELAEGSVWEAANFASYYQLDNLVAIADINGLGQSQQTMFGHDMSAYAKRFESFGWKVVTIDGHNFLEIENAFKEAVSNTSKKPLLILARTEKGKGIAMLSGKDGWHGKALKKDELEKALVELGEINDDLRFELKVPSDFARGPVTPFLPVNARSRLASSNELRVAGSPSSHATPLDLPVYKVGDQIATREIYGQVLAKIGEKNPLIYALDGDVKNSTYSLDFKNVFPDRFIECFIAEQNMVGVAVGLSRFGKKPFVSTFSAFLSRAFDQIRMAGLSESNITFVGSHAGVSIGEDGSSQMALEDLAMLGAIPNSVILHPADATSVAKLLPLLAEHTGISYLRTLRPKTSVLYNADEKFIIGGSKILKQSKDDVLTLVACGITVYEALKAYETLKESGVFVRVVDCYSLQPIDKKTLTLCAKETEKNIIVTVEDHYPHGGLGDFALSALAETGVRLEKMAVCKTPHSGTKDELLDYEEISATHIVENVKKLTK